MNPPAWPEVDAVLAAALEQPESDRAGYVALLCEGRPELGAEVESLLVACRNSGSFLEPRSPEGLRIGPYQIIEPIASGGMGTVFRAERADGQFQQQVAIKMIAFGLDVRPEAIRRFLEERQILADLEHPNISRLLDGGYTEWGAPYLVMEYVDGVPITEYCDRERVGLKEKLRLYLDLCAAVQFAHQHLVIHRDLKPSNVLVAAGGGLKLLDFGIARLLDAEPGASRTITRALTPDYASPEQVRGGPMTTASDVYSLGVLLYELVAGERPYSITNAGMEEVVEQICRRDPPPPSSICPDLHQDVDAIVSKAMRKEPGERYASVRDLADDIGRYVDSRPVSARKGTAHYRLQKFVRRHRLGVAGSIAAAILLATGVGLVVRASRIAVEERDRAQRRFNDVRQLARWMVFDLNGQIAALPGSTAVQKDLVANAIRYLDQLGNEAAGDAGLQRDLAQAYLRIGDVQGNPATRNLGDLKGAATSYRKAEQVARTLVSHNASPEARTLLLDVLRRQVNAYFAAGDKPKATACATEALALARDLARLSPENQDAQSQLAAALYAMWWVTGGPALVHDLMEAAAIYEHLLAQKPSDLNRMRNVALTHKYIAGDLLNRLRQPDPAFEHLDRAAKIDAQRASLAPADPVAKLDLAIDLSQWGGYYELKNDTAKAIEFTQKALAIRREVVASDPHDMWARDRLVYALNRIGHLQLKTAPRAALLSFQEAKKVAGELQTDSLRLPALATAAAGTGEAYALLGNSSMSCAAYAEAQHWYGLGGPGSGGPARSAADRALAKCGVSPK